MAKPFICFLYLWAFRPGAIAQPNTHSFILKGTISSDTGTVSLIPVGDRAYYPGNCDFPEVRIRDGGFLFTGAVLHPYAFRVGLKTGSGWKYISELFFLEPGVQTITCNVDSIWETPHLMNRTMKELRDGYMTGMGPLKFALNLLENKSDSLHAVHKNSIPDGVLAALEAEKLELNNKKDTVLLNYAKRHPASFVALWKLVNALENGYKPIFDATYLHFSEGIKNSHTGKILEQRLKSARAVAIGSLFPKLLLSDRLKKKRVGPEISGSTRYLLIDFWFSHCAPCIAQFETLKRIYSKYRAKGFEIAGISVDVKSQEKEWRKAITRYGLPWLQYWDMDGEASKLSVNKFPSSFLLDGSGKIIEKDLEPYQLEKFLDEKLMKE